MQVMPPYKAIACFDAVMRTGSAMVAAEQLLVTPGAVGQQIRKLENWLGTTLFVRSVRKLTPTEQAIRYWEQIRPAFQQIDEANSSLLNPNTWEVKLSLPPALAHTWFARRMPDLIDKYPELHLHLNASVDKVDIQTGTFDMAVRHFDGDDQNLSSELLLRDEVKVYCSPEYRRRHQLQHPKDLQGLMLLYTTSHAHWARWLAQFSLSLDRMEFGLRFDQSEMAIDAAKRSQGLVLTSPWLVEDDLENRKLIEVFPQTTKTTKSYYLVKGRNRPLREAAQLFYNWLMDQSSKN